MEALQLEEAGQALVAKPTEYNGAKEGYHKFKQQYMLFLIGNPVVDSDQARIISVLSWMTTSTAGNWADNYVDQAIMQGSWGTFAEFKAALDKAFHDHDEEKKALVAMDKLKQDGPAEQYFLHMDQLIQKAGGTTDIQLIVILEKNLSRGLIEKVFSTEEVPTTYHEWRQRAINYNNIWRRRGN
jgi:hypothetical protein